jgi:hypothetical protein
MSSDLTWFFSFLLFFTACTLILFLTSFSIIIDVFFLASQHVQYQVLVFHCTETYIIGYLCQKSEWWDNHSDCVVKITPFSMSIFPRRWVLVSGSSSCV